MKIFIQYRKFKYRFILKINKKRKILEKYKTKYIRQINAIYITDDFTIKDCDIYTYLIEKAKYIFLHFSNR